MGAYMAGLALGSFLAGRFVSRRGDSLRIYAVLIMGLSSDLDIRDVVSKTATEGGMYRSERVLYFREHATGSVMVKESDGMQVASTGDFDLHSHLYPAHLMSLPHSRPAEPLVVAFGCGGTSGSMLLYDEVDRLYDIVYSGPIHPQSNQGSAVLYAREYFQECRRLLKPGGFQCLWLPLHVTAPAYFKIIVKTFLSVYPYVSLWQLAHTDIAFAKPFEFFSQLVLGPEQLQVWISGHAANDPKPCS